ncbi:hypothetical protein pEaSNUABM13_00180 [Erwinia phage pEa_SNUABM_13]|nr:hypothetical protein pEaSNUABM13_00180 [Erwinia phage pEa_SNUABM_13]
MSLIKLNFDKEQTVKSESATKPQLANAAILFGKNAAVIIKRLEELVKIKELDTSKLSTMLELLKDEDATQSLAKKAAGKTLVTAVRNLYKAKTLVATINALRAIKIKPAAGNAVAATTKRGVAATNAKSGKAAGSAASGVVVHTMEQFQTLFEPDDGDDVLSGKRIAKFSGLKKVPGSAIGGMADDGSSDSFYFYTPSPDGPNTAIIFGESADMKFSYKDLIGKGRFTVASVKFGEHIEDVVHGNPEDRKAKQLGTFNDFDKAFAAFVAGVQSTDGKGGKAKKGPYVLFPPVQPLGGDIAFAQVTPAKFEKFTQAQHNKIADQLTRATGGKYKFRAVHSDGMGQGPDWYYEATIEDHKCKTVAIQAPFSAFDGDINDWEITAQTMGGKFTGAKSVNKPTLLNMQYLITDAIKACK